MGIAIFGLNGAGKSTLTHALAKEINFYEMDVEDYYFPEQKKSRKMALEQSGPCDISSVDTLPFSISRSKAEVQEAILKDVKEHSDFILTGVNMNWCDEILSRIELAFWLKAPLEKRLERIQYREEKRFGERALPGGDMYEQQKEFRKVVADRDEKSLEECVKQLRCPVIVLDGTLSISDNVEKIITMWASRTATIHLHRKKVDIQ